MKAFSFIKKSVRLRGIFILPLCVVIIAYLCIPSFSYAAAPRGVSSDLWADTVIGQRDFTEIAAREVVSSKINNPGGGVVDTSVSPGRAYIWDSGNNRIVGVNLSNCYGKSVACDADLIIGQPTASDSAGCNLDSSYQDYPTGPTPSSSTLCGIKYDTHTTLEDKSFAHMYVASNGALFVPDIHNHRILKYNSPFTTDTTADDVWGQSSFTSGLCNRSSVSTASSADNTLCFMSTRGTDGGVTFDSSGNMWVADGGNNRVLRFPFDASTGEASKTADLVLGQSSFTSNSSGTGVNQFHSPVSLTFDASGNLYVDDKDNGRVLKFTPPFSTGMNGATFGSGFTTPRTVQYDSSRNKIWVNDNANWASKMKLFNLDGTLNTDLYAGGVTSIQHGGGSIGLDANNDILVSDYVYGQNVHRIHESGGSFSVTDTLFSPPSGYNLTTSRRLEHAGWVGVAISGNQLIVADGRILYWDNKNTVTNGQAPDGYVGGSSFTDIPGWQTLKTDADGRVWVSKGNEVRVYNGPLTSTSSAVTTFTSSTAFNGIAGGTLSFSDIRGIAPSEHSDYVWFAEPSKHRVFRVKNPLTDPKVDVVLGQKTLTGDQCNRGLYAQAEATGKLDVLCSPGMVSLDKQGNLYVSDHYIETAGNWRLLMFAASLFPTNATQVMFAPNATKEFPRQPAYTQEQSHATFEPAFDSRNRMVVGYNPYLGPRFNEVYYDPTTFNPNNRSDSTYANHDEAFNDYGWAIAMTFDSSDNLYAYDANRGQVRIYKTPLKWKPSATSAVFNPTDDTYSSATNPSTTHGSLTDMEVDGDPDRVAYTKFDLSSLSGKTITGAYLRVRTNANTSSSTINVKSVSDTSWTEGALTHNNRPALDSTLLGTLTPSTAETWYDIDVASYISSQSGNTVSLALENTTSNGAEFYTKEYNTDYDPQLYVTFSGTSSTTDTINPTEDSYVTSDDPTATHGTATRNYSDGSPEKISFYKYNLSSYSGKKIISAVFRVKIGGDPSTATHSAAGVNDTSWTASTLTYNNKPTLTGSTINTIVPETSDVWHDIDITSYSTASIGGQMSFAVNTGSSDGATYYTDNTTDKPVLLLTYE